MTALVRPKNKQIVDPQTGRLDLEWDAYFSRLEALLATTLTGGVASVFGRTGIVTAAASDYDANQVDNNSGVSGAFVSDALDTLDSGKQAASGELTALAALTTTSFGRGLLELSDAAAARTSLGVDTTAIVAVIDGGGSAITTGTKGYVRVPFACTITAARLLADQTGSIVIDIWKDTYANYPPTDADSITGGNEPTISASNKDEDATLTSWTTSVSAGDVLGFNVDSVSTIELCTVELVVTRV